ncbi:divergent polysaccharide deacetylase family protein [Ferrovibrio sp.]|uniref:divergent polysaccharide deacetylase family protein n=1 Tax=Ferrovibrio sp. TaxID=1917215 RepID=UPI001B792CE3|nr:divergent polysaccharide deacetylase family protein [Ferrovibrio sp.]MBP7064958.1 divergent polysaccharide deacetylase family protein [Ferrovibrio sp.]
MTLQADPEDRALPPAGEPGRAGLLGRLLAPFKRRRQQPAEDNFADMLHQQDAGAGLDPDADMGDLGGYGEPMAPPPRREGFKHKLGRVFSLIGLVLWPSFLRGDLPTVNRRLLVLAWTLFLGGFISLIVWLAVSSQSLVSLPGSEVVIGVSRLTLPPEAKLAPEQKAGEGQSKPAADSANYLPSGLLVAPDPLLVEATPAGQVPKIGSDGRQPWRAYARPYDEPADRPRLAIVLGDLGLNQTLTTKAAELLPPAISFAFNPHAPNLAQQVEYARSRGHEVLLQLPMEPFDYPANDPGPYTLLTTLTEGENMRRLDWSLARVPGYIGFTNFMGAKYTSSPEHMRYVAQTLKNRGLLFVDARTAPRSVAARSVREAGGVYAIGNRQIDQQPTGPVIESRLEELERLARGTGVALGFAQPYPITLDRLLAWSKTIGSKSIALAPVSAIVNRQTPE